MHREGSASAAPLELRLLVRRRDEVEADAVAPEEEEGGGGPAARQAKPPSAKRRKVRST